MYDLSKSLHPIHWLAKVITFASGQLRLLSIDSSMYFFVLVDILNDPAKKAEFTSFTFTMQRTNYNIDFAVQWTSIFHLLLLIHCMY